MSRKARNYSDAPYYHVMVQGIKKEYIFFNNYFKSAYLKILEKYIAEYKIKMIAFCIMGNHAHMLLKPNSIKDLSCCMREVNSCFAERYNKKLDRVGYVFRDRFASEEIYETYYLHNCIRYIHMNPVAAGICDSQSSYYYSSYNDYCSKTGLLTPELYNEIFVCAEDYEKVVNNTKDLEKFVDEEIGVEDLRNIVDMFLKEHNLDLYNLRNNQGELFDLVYFLKKNYNVKNIAIASVLGVSTACISRKMKKSIQ